MFILVIMQHLPISLAKPSQRPVMILPNVLQPHRYVDHIFMPSRISLNNVVDPFDRKNGESWNKKEH